MDVSNTNSEYIFPRIILQTIDLIVRNCVNGLALFALCLSITYINQHPDDVKRINKYFAFLVCVSLCVLCVCGTRASTETIIVSNRRRTVVRYLYLPQIEPVSTEVWYQEV